MTERVCLVGNSHLIMLQKAWTELDPAPEGIDAVFFGALIRHYRELDRDEARGVLVASGDLAKFFGRSSGGLTEIDPARYDRFVVVGMRIGIIEIYRALRNLIPSAHAGGSAEIRRLLSHDLFEIWVREYFEATAGFDLVRRLNAIAGKPVTLVPQPHVANKLLASKMGSHLPPADDPLYAYLDGVFRAAVRAAAAAAGAEVRFQPESTLAGPGLSRPDYLAGAVSFSDRSFPDDDVGHMNAAFGRLILKDLGMIGGA